MLVSDYILRRLADVGIDTAFVVYGGAIAEFMDAFTRTDRIRYVVMIHEQAAVFAAEGYAKVKGVPGLVIVTSGPGGGNIVTGLQNCFYDSTPMIAITGQINSKFIKPEGSPLRQLGFQETDMVSIARPITKFAMQPHGVYGVKGCVDAAIHKATSGRPGPALLDLPIDVQRMEMA